MVAFKSRLRALVAAAAVIITVSVVLRMRPGSTPPVEPEQVEARGPAVEDYVPPVPRTDLTEAERARIEGIVSEVGEARTRIVLLNRELVHARAAVIRENPAARAALERQRAAQLRRAAALAADAEIIALREKIAALNTERAELLARFRALALHEAEHGRPGPEGEAPPKMAGCSYCDEFGPAAALPRSVHRALSNEEARLQEERRTAHAAHAAAVQRVDAEPEIVATLAEATQAEADLQALVQAEAAVSELIRERDAWTEKQVALVKERADILRPRPVPGQVVSNGMANR